MNQKSGKLKGKKAEPSAEELELIYGLIARGLSDTEILEEMQDTEFPMRTSGFIKRRRREYSAARKISETVSPVGKGELGVQAVEGLPAGKYLVDHYQKLHKVLEQFYNQFRTPKVLELCLFTLKDSVTISYSYVSEMRVPAIVYEKGAVKLDVEVSDPFLWERLQEHLTAEFPELSQNLGDWKRDIAALVERCHDITKTIVGQLAKKRWDSAEPYLDQASKDYGPGVFYDILTDLVYECLITRRLPEFQRVSDSRGLLILVMEHSTGRQSVARGEGALLDQVQQHCVDIVKSLARKKRITKVLDIVEQLDSKQELFRKKMRVVLERGTFKGTCSICSDLVGKSG